MEGDVQPRMDARTTLGLVPPEGYFVVSAIFHYMGPAFAVLLFTHIAPTGVAWLRIASAAFIFAIWKHPWKAFKQLNAADQLNVLTLGLTLAAMNTVFYLALDGLPLATVAGIEFLGPIGLAAAGARNARNGTALLLAVSGAYILTDVRFEGAPAAYAFAFANCLLFVLYLILGHRLSRNGGLEGIQRLAMAMLIAAVAALPFGASDAAPAFSNLYLLAAAIGVGICSSVIPYICDQLAMARLSRATFALMLTLLPASATVIGALVLRQIPKLSELAAIGLIIAGVALHRRRQGHS
jgi:inner membrane transporter RhtA